MDDSRPNISNFVVAGMSTPAMLTAALLLNVLLLGTTLVMCIWVLMSQNRLYTELRVLQIHTQDLNAILIREGIKKPGDAIDPTDGRNK